MLITKVSIYKSRIKLKQPFITSLGSLTHSENIILVIHTNQGLQGFGECSPFMSINGESIDTCFIVAQYLAKALINKSTLDIEQCSQIMDSVIYGNSSIKSAFDIALHDIASQHAEVPLYSFLGGTNEKQLITDYTVCLDEVEKMVRDSLRIMQEGYKVIKVKLGDTPEQDIKRIQSIREAVGPDIPLRIDANQGWQKKDAIQVLNALAGSNIQFCEEPISRHDYMDLPSIKQQSPIPLMADECCCDHHDAKRLISIGACDLFNLKLGKSSGIRNALKVIRLAQDAGIMMQVGGFLESRLAFTASAHLALSSEHILFCDMDTPLMFEEDPVEGGIKISSGGVINVPDTPGLGARFNEVYLNGLPKIEID